MEELKVKLRPNIKAGNLANKSYNHYNKSYNDIKSNNSIKKHESNLHNYTNNINDKLKKNHIIKSEFKIPDIFKPRLCLKPDDKYTFTEEGGCVNASFGFAKLICSSNGDPKTPIFIYKPYNFKNTNKKMSLIFHIKNKDYIITTGYNYIKKYISLYIFQIYKNKYECKDRLIYHYTIKIDFNITNNIQKIFNKKLTEIKLNFLIPVVECAIAKSLFKTITYSWFTKAPLATKYSNTVWNDKFYN